MEMHSRPLMPLLKADGSLNGRHASKVSDVNNSPVNTSRNNNEIRAKVTVGPFGKESSPQVLSNHTRLQNAMARSNPAYLPDKPIKEDLITQRSIERLLLHLPPELKSNIIDFMSEMTSSVKRLETVIKSQKLLLKETISAHERKCKELDTSERNCEVYRGRIADAEDKYSTLADVMDSKDKHSSKTQMAISRLNKANLTLTQALNSIQSSRTNEAIFKNSHLKNRNDDKILESDPTDDDSMWLTHGKDGCDTFDGVLQLEASPSSPASQCLGKFSPGPRKIESSPNMTLNSANHESRHSNMRERKTSLMRGEDMRNAMLKLTREKYRFTKKVEILGNEVDDLKAKLKLSDLKCRHLQINLAEYTGTDSSNDFFNGVAAAQALQTKTKDFGPRDDLFRMMIDRRTLDPVGSILQFRRIVDWMARVPEGSLKIQTVCGHMCSEHMLQTLNVDLICIYVVDTNNRSKVSKYTVRSEVGEVLTYNESSSILAEVINTGKVLKYTDLKSSPFDLKMDGCPGVLVRNILSVPLMNETTGNVLGAIHLINKIGGKIGFTELDETFASYFALSASTSLLGCLKFKHAKYRSSMLTSILTSTSAILSLVPRRDDVFMRDVNISELLSVVENSCQIALHCFKVKVFLLTDQLLGMPPGYTLFAPERGRHSPKLKRDSTPHLEHARFNLGTAGFVIQTKKWVVQDRDMDEHYHPDVDLDPQGMPCVTLAVPNIEGDVLLCLQMVLGPGSPRIHLSESRADGITFEQAAQWYVNSLSTPLQCVIENMNKKSKIKEDAEALFPETLLGPSGDGGRDREGERERECEREWEGVVNKEETDNSFSAIEISDAKQQREREQREELVRSDILENKGQATQSPSEWAASIVQKVDQCHLPSVPRSGSATPGSVWSRRSSV